MRVEYINPFVGSITSVFRTMLGCSLTRGEPYAKISAEPEYELNGVVRLSGKAEGTVVLRLSWETARNLTAALLRQRPSEIETDVTDAVGELANMVAGGAKAQLEQFALEASLPTVTVGKDADVEFPEGATPICIPFESELGPICLEVGLAEEPAEALVAV